VRQDYIEAANWFRKAADQGNADAQTSLGVLYVNGQGVPKCPSRNMLNRMNHL
jgi:TPR repeat protein